MPEALRTAIARLCLVLRQTPAPATCEAYAVRFGILPAFPVSSLVAGADRSRRLDVPVLVRLLKGANGRTVLIDARTHGGVDAGDLYAPGVVRIR